MSGKLPIDRAREAQDAPAIYDEHRERFAQKQAKLANTNDIAEGERPPEDTSRVADAGDIPPARRADDAATAGDARGGQNKGKEARGTSEKRPARKPARKSATTSGTKQAKKQDTKQDKKEAGR
jgi:hypothetical protein